MYRESEVVLSSATRKLYPQLNEQWLQHLQDHRLLAANLIAFKDWLESTALIHEDFVPNCGRRHNKLLHSDFSKREATTAALDATTAVATNITQGGLPVVHIKRANGNHSLSVLAMCDTGSSTSFVDKSIVSTLQLQDRKAFFSVARIHGSQDVKTETVPISVSAQENHQPLTTVQFYVHEKLKLRNQIVDLQGLKGRYPHLKNLPKSELPFKRSSMKQVATLATTETSVSEDKLASQLSKCWDIESYASNCDVTGHSTDEHRAIKTLEQTTRFTGERYEVGLLWREDEVKLPNNFYSAMGQLKSLERRLQKDDILRKRYQETSDTDVKAGYVRKVQQIELNETKDMLQWYLPHHPVINPHKTRKSQKSVQRSSKTPKCCPQRQTSIWTRPVAASDRNFFSLPRTPIAISADIEAMILQVAVPSDDNRCLRFLWRKDPE
ncbi:uncharacterized protein LOC142354150 [Convolutriloba macropyga]|uniref:uncharacterized protein LOC142354150 n=1 Tax=Convolutriloba macropyga TaxID=536237 RepID=UPI003F52603E